MARPLIYSVKRVLLIIDGCCCGRLLHGVSLEKAVCCVTEGKMQGTCEVHVLTDPARINIRSFRTSYLFWKGCCTFFMAMKGYASLDHLYPDYPTRIVEQ